MTYMDLDKYVPSMDMLDEYEPIQEWLCDYCNADQVYIGGGRMACANDKCENVLGKLGDGFEHMTGSFADMNDLGSHQVEELISEFDSRLFNIIMSGDNEKKIEELIDNYKGSWAYATADQLIEELELLYRNGIKGLTQMDYHEILREWNEYQVKDKKDYGDRI